MPATLVRPDCSSPPLTAGCTALVEPAPVPRLARDSRPVQTPRRKAETPPPADERDTGRTLIDALVTSKIYQDYERAFTLATGLPVALRPVEFWQLPHHGHKGESPVCALVAGKSKACSMCLQVQDRLVNAAREEPATVTCEIGLCDTAVPVKLGEKVVGFLQTGQVLRRPPAERQFRKVQQMVQRWGMDPDSRELRVAFFATRVVSQCQHEAIVKLLGIFAQHLSLLNNQIVLQQENAEPPIIRRAKEYIHEHQTEDLNLTQVARAVSTSTFYFCKVFKKATGINFTDYLSRVRIEKSKNLLMNPNLRVSEIAFEVGFQSLTHFNRVFKKILGQSPTEYRAKLLGG